MKTTVVIILSIALQGIFAISTVNAQTVATGHATAEIVESVSVSSLAVTSFAISNCSEPLCENLSLGEIKVNSGSSVACNVVIKPATLSSTDGGSFTIEPSTDNSSVGSSSVLPDSQCTDGNRTIQLTASTRTLQGQASGLYKGSYTIVFAYN